jgi:hypothetical protein
MNSIKETSPMKTRLFLNLCLIPLAFCSEVKSEQFHFPQAKATVYVIDENDKPLSDAQVKLVFCLENDNIRIAPSTGLTDVNGRFSAQGFCAGSLGSSINKDGYYMGSANIPRFRDVKDDKWQPWDTTNTTILRKIEKPVAFYGRSFRNLIVPDIQKPCGYDLKLGDWIAPYGKGKASDFILTVERHYENRDNFSVSAVISFSNVLDGIQQTELPKEWKTSMFKWPRLAPEIGYLPTLSAGLKTDLGKGYIDTASDDQAYFFRVRTVEQDGKIVSAFYGEIKGPLRIDARENKTCSMQFTYYLNPTSLDRNMEFDPKQNLFTNLPPSEQPRIP